MVELGPGMGTLRAAGGAIDGNQAHGVGRDGDGGALNDSWSGENLLGGQDGQTSKSVLHGEEWVRGRWFE